MTKKKCFFFDNITVRIHTPSKYNIASGFHDSYFIPMSIIFVVF